MSTEPISRSTTTPSRWRFSLRALLLLMAVLTVVFAWVAPSFRTTLPPPSPELRVERSYTLEFGDDDEIVVPELSGRGAKTIKTELVLVENGQSRVVETRSFDIASTEFAGHAAVLWKKASDGQQAQIKTDISFDGAASSQVTSGELQLAPTLRSLTGEWLVGKVHLGESASCTVFSSTPVCHTD